MMLMDDTRGFLNEAQKMSVFISVETVERSMFNMGFDAIPEDREQSFPCEVCNGSIKLSAISGLWECVECGCLPGSKLVFCCFSVFGDCNQHNYLSEAPND